MKRFIKQTQFLLLSFIAVTLVSTAAVVQPALAADCGGVSTSIIQCEPPDPNASDLEKSGLWQLLLFVINILTAGVGILALAGLVYGSVLYTSAGGNQEQVKKAASTITNVVIGIIAWAAMFSFLQYLIPGGIFN